MRRYRENPHMDLMDKLASLSQRYEELNNLMAQPEVLEDIPLLQRYGREHAELQEVVQNTTNWSKPIVRLPRLEKCTRVRNPKCVTLLSRRLSASKHKKSIYSQR